MAKSIIVDENFDKVWIIKERKKWHFWWQYQPTHVAFTVYKCTHIPIPSNYKLVVAVVAKMVYSRVSVLLR